MNLSPPAGVVVNPMTAPGDLIAGAAGGAPARLALGALGTFLGNVGGVLGFGAAVGTQDFFGDGSDGAVVFDGTNSFAGFATTTGVAPNLVYTLIRDVTATNLTINAGVVVNTGGFRVLCTGTLTISGTLQNNGGNATGANQANAGVTAPRGSFGGATNAPGAAGAVGAGATPANINNSIGGGGGAGGVGGSAGGTAGGAANPSSGLAAASVQGPHTLPFALMGAAFGPSALVPFGIGNGGASGAGDGTNKGGAGGGGGGGIIIAAATLAILAAAAVVANGGNGGTPTTAAALLGDGGGGGGGGGFIIAITHRDLSTSVLTAGGGQANGGTHGSGLNGAGGAGATNGGDGSAGTIVLLVI